MATHAQIAVHAYIALLAQGRPQDSNLMAKELLEGRQAVVPSLLAHPSPDAQTLALELLAHFVRTQQDADFFPPLEAIASCL